MRFGTDGGAGGVRGTGAGSLDTVLICGTSVELNQVTEFKIFITLI